MAFFDSPKNMALWNKELANLDAERERRKKEGYKPEMKVVDGSGRVSRTTGNNPHVRRITLKELEEIERNARAEKNAGSEMSAGAQKKALRNKGSLSKEASAVM